MRLQSQTQLKRQQTRYRLEQGGFCSSKTHSVNTYLWVDLGPGGRSDALVLSWWPSDPSPSPLSSQHPSPSALFPGSDTWGCKNFSGSYVSQLHLGQPEGAPAGDRREEVYFFPTLCPGRVSRGHLISSMAPAPCRPAHQGFFFSASLSVFSLYVPVNFCSYWPISTLSSPIWLQRSSNIGVTHSLH